MSCGLRDLMRAPFVEQPRRTLFYKEGKTLGFESVDQIRGCNGALTLCIGGACDNGEERQKGLIDQRASSAECNHV